MTPEEYASVVLKNYDVAIRVDMRRAVLWEITSAVRAAVAEEKEACARLCDERYAECLEPEIREMACAIRARQ